MRAGTHVVTRFAAVLGGLLLGLSSAAAQPADVQQTIREMYAQFTHAGAAPSAEEGKLAQTRIEALRVNRKSMDKALLAKLMGAEALWPLATGDAATAVKGYQAMHERLPERAETYRVGYLVAAAAGDAQMAEQVLKDLSKLVDSSARREVSRMRRCMRHAGERAPQVEIRAGDDEYETDDRGDRTLVIHFWNIDAATEHNKDAALETLAAWAKKDGSVDFVGVNADEESRYDEARKFAKEHGYDWPQRYEDKSYKAPITDEAFHVGSPPWLVVIDTYGYLRAAGDADDPAVYYAMRASAAEAAGDFARVLPTARDGTRPEQLSARMGGGGSKADSNETGQPKSNPQAADKLRQARLFLKTGMKTKAKALFQEIIRDYPGTEEARKAKEYLDSLP